MHEGRMQGRKKSARQREMAREKPQPASSKGQAW
jgi:hypothetical protein